MDNETQGYLDGHKLEAYVPKITINVDKINVDSFDIGDIVKVIMNNGFVLISQKYRIIKKQINVTENQKLIVDVNLLPFGVNLLPSNFFDVIVKLDRRIALLEGA